MNYYNDRILTVVTVGSSPRALGMESILVDTWDFEKLGDGSYRKEYNTFCRELLIGTVGKFQKILSYLPDWSLKVFMTNSNVSSFDQKNLRSSLRKISIQGCTNFGMDEVSTRSGLVRRVPYVELTSMSGGGLTMPNLSFLALALEHDSFLKAVIQLESKEGLAQWLLNHNISSVTDRARIMLALYVLTGCGQYYGVSGVDFSGPSTFAAALAGESEIFTLLRMCTLEQRSFLSSESWKWRAYVDLFNSSVRLNREI